MGKIPIFEVDAGLDREGEVVRLEMVKVLTRQHTAQEVRAMIKVFTLDQVKKRKTMDEAHIGEGAKLHVHPKLLWASVDVVDDVRHVSKHSVGVCEAEVAAPHDHHRALVHLCAVVGKARDPCRGRSNGRRVHAWVWYCHIRTVNPA